MNSLHFSPHRNWMNDPNGLIFHKGRYHLYFQHNPLGIDHGNMSWGHASSIDLIHWEHHPVAIEFDEAEEIFSGSIVVDAENTTGFGTAANPALVAFYTSESRTRDHQAQSVAFSLDDGMTWTKYADNPVLDRSSAHFRDPKIIRWEGAAESYWVMVAVEAEDRQVVLYRSDDLLSWTHLSSFGPEAAVGGVWECPDLFPLRLEGTDETHWVLLVSLSPGGIGGSSGTQYFVGEFDGRAFTPHERSPRVRPDDDTGMRSLDWLDYGHDCYAGVSFAGLPDDRRTLIAWMSNWDYARTFPVDPERPVRGSTTLPRRLSLVSVDGRPRLLQTPVAPPVTETTRLEGVEVSDPLLIPGPVGQRIELTAALDGASGFALRFEGDDERVLEIVYDAASQELSCDRRGSSAGFPEEFAGVRRMPVAAAPEITLTLWLDERSVEIYAEDGTRVLTDLIGVLRAPRLCVAGVGGSVRIMSLVMSEIAGASAADAAEAPGPDPETDDPGTDDPGSRRALVIGEALIDIVKHADPCAEPTRPRTEHRTEDRVEEHVGGSPANVAIGIARLGHPVRLLTRLGRDERGRRIAGLLSDEGVELLPDSWDAGATSTAHARIAADGSADYRFDIDWRLPERAPRLPSLVHAGSIALFLEPGGSRVLRLLERFAETALVTLDPNIRPSLLGDHADAVRRFERAAALADLVKLSDEDAAWLYPELGLEAAALRVRELGPSIVVVTLGPEGAFAFSPGGISRIQAREVEVVDTISAGDSFMASLASSLLDLGLDGTLAALPQVLDRAARAAAIAVSVAGANPPRRDQLDVASA